MKRGQKNSKSHKSKKVSSVESKEVPLSSTEPAKQLPIEEEISVEDPRSQQAHKALKELYSTISSILLKISKSGPIQEWTNNFGRAINKCVKFSIIIKPKILNLYNEHRSNILNILSNKDFLKSATFVFDITPDESKAKFRLNIAKSYNEAEKLKRDVSLKIKDNATTELIKKKNKSLMNSEDYLLCYEIEYRIIKVFLYCLNEDHDDINELTEILGTLEGLSHLDIESVKKETTPSGTSIFQILGDIIPGSGNIKSSDMNSEQVRGLLGNIIRPDLADQIADVFEDKDDDGNADVTVEKFFEIVAPALSENNDFIPKGVNIMENNREKFDAMKEKAKELGNMVIDYSKETLNPNNQEEESDYEETDSS